MSGKLENLNLLKKLHFLQGEVDKFTKDTKGYGYTYTKGSTILNKLRPLWHEKGLILKQEIIEVKNQLVSYTTQQNKDKLEVLSEVEFRFTWIDSETGEYDVNLWSANGMNDFEKGIGSAATYAERYFLLKYFHIHSDEDDVDNKDRKKDDNENNKSEKTAKRIAQEKFIQANEKEYSKMINACIKKYGQQSYKNLSDEELEKLKTAISDKKNKGKDE